MPRPFRKIPTVVDFIANKAKMFVLMKRTSDIDVYVVDVFVAPTHAKKYFNDNAERNHKMLPHNPSHKAPIILYDGGVEFWIEEARLRLEQ